MFLQVFSPPSPSPTTFLLNWVPFSDLFFIYTNPSIPNSSSASSMKLSHSIPPGNLPKHATAYSVFIIQLNICHFYYHPLCVQLPEISTESAPSFVFFQGLTQTFLIVGGTITQGGSITKKYSLQLQRCSFQRLGLSLVTSSSSQL